MLSRRSHGLRWTRRKTPGGRSALVTLRLTIWFWSDYNTCRKGRGSATFASTDLFNRQARPLIASLSSLMPCSFCPVPSTSFLLTSSPSRFLRIIPPLEDTHIYGLFPEEAGCWVLWRPHCPQVSFLITLERLFGKIKGSVYIQQSI